METGSRDIKNLYLQKDSSLDVNRFKQCHTTFLLKKDGLSFIIYDISKKNILAFCEHSWSSNSSDKDILHRLEQIFLDFEFNFEDGLSNSWYINSPKMCFSPLELFEENMGAQILGLSSRINSDEIVKNETWPKHHIVCSYAISKALDDWLNFNFPQSEKFHHSQASMQLFNHYPQYGTYIHLHVEKNYSDLLICQDGRITMFNQFSFKVEEDLLYYLLFAFEQHRILAPEVDVYISGNLKSDSKFYDLLSNYVGNVHKVELPKSILVSPSVRKESLIRSFSLLGSL